jgi:hypothetical protein
MESYHAREEVREEPREEPLGVAQERALALHAPNKLLQEGELSAPPSPRAA